MSCVLSGGTVSHDPACVGDQPGQAGALQLAVFIARQGADMVVGARDFFRRKQGGKRSAYLLPGERERLRRFQQRGYACAIQRIGQRDDGCVAHPRQRLQRSVGTRVIPAARRRG